MSDPDTPGAVPPPPKVVPAEEPILPSGFPTPPMGTPVSPPPPPGSMDPTTQLPSTPPSGGAAMPPGMPPGTHYGDPQDDPYDDPYGDPEPIDDTPWYKRPAAVALLLFVLLAFGALIAWWLLSGGDDDAASADSTLIVVEVEDQNGAPLESGFLIDVQGPAGDETSFEWIRPAGAVAGSVTGDGTGPDGRVEFEWAIDPDRVDPDSWSATVTMAQSLPPGWMPANALAECVLKRPGGPDTIVTMSVTVVEGEPGSDIVVNYAFPNSRFGAGDTVECGITNIRPVDDTTTTAPTTVAPTTVAPTTVAPTTVAPTTVAPATSAPAPTTTTPVVTVPPQPEATLWDVIDNSPDLSELKALIQRAGLVDVLDDPDATLTLLAPTNQAITNAAGGVGAPDFGDEDVAEAILLSHVDNTQVLLSVQLLALDPPELVVVNPGPHAIDAAAAPPTIGGAGIVLVDVQAANGVLHVIDRVLLPVVLP